MAGGAMILAATTVEGGWTPERRVASPGDLSHAPQPPALIETMRIRNGDAPLWYLHLRRLAKAAGHWAFRCPAS